MALRERDVVSIFAAELRNAGWQTEFEVDWVDIVGRRDGRTLLGEAKGSTTAPGLDVDTAFGQLLRRMRDDDASYAIVVADSASAAARRVSQSVLERLNISVYAVGDDGSVSHIAGPDAAGFGKE